MVYEIVYKLCVNYVIYCCYGSDTGHVRVTISGCWTVMDGSYFCAKYVK